MSSKSRVVLIQLDCRSFSIGALYDPCSGSLLPKIVVNDSRSRTSFHFKVIT